MPIIKFLLGESGNVLPVAVLLFIADLFVTTFVKICFGTTHGFYLAHSDGAILKGKRYSLSEILGGAS